MLRQQLYGKGAFFEFVFSSVDRDIRQLAMIIIACLTRWRYLWLVLLFMLINKAAIRRCVVVTHASWLCWSGALLLVPVVTC